MTMMPIWKTCPKCHQKYDWNPDVGTFGCPYCFEKNRKRTGKLGKIIEKRMSEKYGSEPDDESED